MEQSTLSISVLWRGKKFILEISSCATLEEFGNELQKLTDVKADTMRLIVPQSSNKSSKLLSPFSDEHSRLSLLETSIPEGKSIRMMGASEHEVDEVLQNAKANLRIAGFDEEERRLRQRMQDRRHALLKLPQGTYIFCDFRTLEIPGIKLNPPASEALKRMHMLAADPGITAIMNKHRWRVGIMTEMAPVGYVGVSPQCILGLNKNHGEEISLRLRTDDLKGFRKYESIKKTLLHELAHMVYSEHDANFYALDKQLNEEATALDWTKSRSHSLGGIKYSEHHDEELYFEESSNFSHKLGGHSSDQLASARASSVVAAYSRLLNSNSGVAEVHNEPDPDDLGFNMLEDSSGPKNSLTEEKVVDESPSKAQLKPYLEPDPDDCDSLKYGDQSGSDCVQMTSPLDRETVDEPDPDDSEADINNLGIGDIMKHGRGDPPVSETMEDQTQLNRTRVEPDPDDSSVNTVIPSSGLNGQVVDEPDPDDVEVRRIQDPVTIVYNRLHSSIQMLQSEATPMEINSVLQTLFKIIRNLVEHPEETKFKRLRMANPVFQKNVANYKAAMDVLSLIGFIEDVVLDEIGKVETYLVLKRNDPGLLWLVKSSLETSIGR